MNKRSFLNLTNSLFGVAYLASIIESITYPGFLIKHSSPLMYGAFLFLVIILSLVINKNSNKEFYRKTIIGIAIVSVSLYLSMNFLENIKYSNFVFSHYHLHPELLFLPVVLITIIFVLNINRNRKLGYGVIVLVLIQFIVKDFNIIKNYPIHFFWENIGMNYDEKMEKVVGRVPYNFTVFIKNNTPENSTILIPPQGYPWEKTGNSGYLRYFLYPRKLINGNEKDSKVDIGNIDYVLIDYGESNIFEYGYTNVWPKFDVKGEYTIYWNPYDGTTYKGSDRNYVYRSDVDNEQWGIVKVKK